MNDHSAGPRVLHLIPNLAVGGSERELVEFLRRSSAPDRHPVATFRDGAALASELPQPPTRLQRPGTALPGLVADLSAAPALHRFVRQERVDVVHAHLRNAEVLAALATPRGVPVVTTYQGRSRRFERGPWRLISGLAHRRTRVMVCNSAELRDHTVRHDLWPPATQVVYNAIDTEDYAELPLPDQSPTVVMVANLISYKRHDVFLRALALCADQVPGLRALVVGEGPERHAIERMVLELGLQGRVELLGRVPDVRPVIARAHAVALTSDHEGFPYALMEAMAMGRAVVATGVGGVPELVRDGVDGYLSAVTPTDVAQQLTRLFQDPHRLAEMGSSAAERVRHFTWERYVEQMEALYLSVAEGRRNVS